MALFEVGQRRLNTIGKGIQTGTGVIDHRGGAKREAKYADRKESVRAFIGKLKVSESHYGRNKSKRVYLNSELNIARLVKMHNDLAPKELEVNTFVS